MTRSLVLSCVVLALAACGFAGCGSDDGGGSMSAGDLCQAYVDAMCGGLAECCDTSNEVECRRIELDYCVNELLTEDDRGTAPVGPNVPARIVFDFDEESAAAAIARVNGVFSRCEGLPLVTFADTHVLGEPGAECLEQRDCVAGTRCDHPPLAIFGTCVLAPLEGQTCVDRCGASGLSCVQDGDESVCVADGSKGDSCVAAPCESGLVCVATGSVIGGGGPRTCQGPLRAGAICQVGYDCESNVCVGGRCQEASARESFCATFPGYALGSSGVLAP